MDEARRAGPVAVQAEIHRLHLAGARDERRDERAQPRLIEFPDRELLVGSLAHCLDRKSVV